MGKEVLGTRGSVGAGWQMALISILNRAVRQVNSGKVKLSRHVKGMRELTKQARGRIYQAKETAKFKGHNIGVSLCSRNSNEASEVRRE